MRERIEQREREINGGREERWKQKGIRKTERVLESSFIVTYSRKNKIKARAKVNKASRNTITCWPSDFSEQQNKTERKVKKEGRLHQTAEKRRKKKKKGSVDCLQ